MVVKPASACFIKGEYRGSSLFRQAFLIRIRDDVNLDWRGLVRMIMDADPETTGVPNVFPSRCSNRLVTPEEQTLCLLSCSSRYRRKNRVEFIHTKRTKAERSNIDPRETQQGVSV